MSGWFHKVIDKYGVRKTFILLYAVIATFIGWTYQLTLRWYSPVAFRLRPELINLDFWEALFSGHFMEWTFKFYPKETFMINVILFPLLGILAGWWITMGENER